MSIIYAVFFVKEKNRPKTDRKKTIKNRVIIDAVFSQYSIVNAVYKSHIVLDITSVCNIPLLSIALRKATTSIVYAMSFSIDVSIDVARARFPSFSFFLSHILIMFVNSLFVIVLFSFPFCVLCLFVSLKRDVNIPFHILTR